MHCAPGTRPPGACPTSTGRCPVSNRSSRSRNCPTGWHEARGSAATTHIIKPGIGRLHHQSLVEHATMRAASTLGLDVAHTEFTRFGDSEPAIVIKRYDRVILDDDDGVLRLHQEDFCSASGRLPSKKYEAHGGPGLADLARIVEQNSRGHSRHQLRRARRLRRRQLRHRRARRPFEKRVPPAAPQRDQGRPALRPRHQPALRRATRACARSPSGLAAGGSSDRCSAGTGTARRLSSVSLPSSTARPPGRWPAALPGRVLRRASRGRYVRGRRGTEALDRPHRPAYPSAPRNASTTPWNADATRPAPTCRQHPAIAVRQASSPVCGLHRPAVTRRDRFQPPGLVNLARTIRFRRCADWFGIETDRRPTETDITFRSRRRYQTPTFAVCTITSLVTFPWSPSATRSRPILLGVNSLRSVDTGGS